MDIYGGICHHCGKELINCICKKNSDTVNDFIEMMSEINEKAAYPTDLKEAIIGRVDRFGMQPLILLDHEKCIQIFMNRDGMTREQAEEFFEFNVIGSWIGEGTPCFASFIKDIIF